MERRADKTDGHRNRIAERGSRHDGSAAGGVGATGGARGFSSLGTIDRVVYDNYEPLVATLF